MGVYYEPPYYPFTITAIDMFTNPDPNASGDDAYTIEVRDDDGVDGAPGTLIGLESIDAGSYTSAWNRTDLSFPITITSGGFYVAWVMQGNTLSIGTEGAGAISRRFPPEFKFTGVFNPKDPTFMTNSLLPFCCYKLSVTCWSRRIHVNPSFNGKITAVNKVECSTLMP